MKLTADTRINAVMYVKEHNGIPHVLQSQDRNITLIQYITECSVIAKMQKTPIPMDILDMDFEVENVHYNSHGHRFTVLGYKDKKLKKACVIYKLDLAGTY